MKTRSRLALEALENRLTPAPVVTAGTAENISFGSTFNGSFSFTDDPTNSPWNYSISYGDYSSAQTGPATPNTIVNFSHTYYHSGENLVTVSVTNANNDVGSASFDVFVASPTTVYVNNAWAGTALGADPTNGAGPAHAFGAGGDAFANISSALGTVAAGGNVDVYGSPAAETLNLTNNVTIVALTANSKFNVGGWTGTASFTGDNSIVTSSKSASYTLTNSSLMTTDGLNLSLQSVQAVNMAGTGGNHTYNISGYTGLGSVTTNSYYTDEIIASQPTGYVLTNSLLTNSLGLSMSLNVGRVSLTDTEGGNTFDVSGWTGTGVLDNTSANPDTLVIKKNAGSVLSNNALTTTDGMSMQLLGVFGTANITDLTGGHTYYFAGWTGNGSIVSLGKNTGINVQKRAGFVLTNNSIVTTDGMDMSLTNVVVANIVDDIGGNSFDVSGWTGTGSISNAGVTSDTLSVTKNAGFTLTDTLLTSTDGMSMVLSNLKVANLTDTNGGHTFTVTGWNHTGTLTNQGTTVDSLVAVKNAITLNNGSISSNDGMSLNLVGNIGLNVSGNVNLSNWIGTGSFSGGTVTAVKDASFTLTNSQLTSTDGMSVNISFSTANLTDTGGNNSFTVNGWTGAGTFTGLSSDTINATKSANFTLGNSVLSSSDGMSLTLSGIGHANLADTGGNHTLTVSSWTGNVNFVNFGIKTDTVVASKNANFTLTNSLLNSSDGMSLGMSGITTANLTDTGGSHTFTVDGWSGNGKLTGLATDTLSATKNASFTLGNTQLSSTDGMVMSLSGIKIADLTDTGGNGNTFNVTSWTGKGVLTGDVDETDVVIKNVAFTLMGNTLTATDGMSMTLANILSSNVIR